MLVVSDPLYPLVEGLLGDLTEVTAVSQMYRKPTCATFAQTLALSKLEESFDVISPLVVEVRHRIHTTTEVHVLR